MKAVVRRDGRGNSGYNGASANNGPGMGSAVVPEFVDTMSGNHIRPIHWWFM